MNMARNVYEYEREGQCIYMFRYTYAGIREMKMHMERDDRHMSKAMSTSIGTVTKVSIKFVEKKKKTKR